MKPNNAAIGRDQNLSEMQRKLDKNINIMEYIKMFPL
jgi:hypothetical protein